MDFQVLIRLSVLSHRGGRHSGGGGGKSRSPLKRDNYWLKYYLWKILWKK